MKYLPAAALFALIATHAAAGQVAGLCFTPGQECTGLIVAEIGAARREILVQAYSFTSPEIVAALVAATKRGVAVRALLDVSNVKPGHDGRPPAGKHAAEALAMAGAEVRIDEAHEIAHNKVIILDRVRVITGSFNFSRSAQTRNAENVAVLDGADVADRYAANWATHAAHSVNR